MKSIIKWLGKVFCRHKPVKKPVLGGYCTFGFAYWTECKKCGKRLGSGIDKY